MKKIKYLLAIFSPFILLLLIAIPLSKITTLVDFDNMIIRFEFTKLILKHPRRVAYILIVLFGWQLLRFKNTKKEFAPVDMYGKFPYYLYILVRVLIGYNKVDLKMKPIPLQFKLLDNNRFECFDSTSFSDKKVKYRVSYVGNINKKTEKINLIVSDTYKIPIDKIPKSAKEFPTILISRTEKKNDGLRIYSQQLIDIIHSEVEKSKSKCKNYNLFLTTTGKTNMEIYRQVFQTGHRDDFVLNIYQANSNNDFKYDETPAATINS